MSDEHPYSVDTARQAAERDALWEWISEFLASPGSDNADLVDKLAEVPRWWTGPVELPLDHLHRLVGPPGAPAIAEIDEHEWRDDVDDLADAVADGFEPPPVVVTAKGDQLVLEDGNHRVEALRRAGRTAAWGVVGFEDEAERDAFVPPGT